MNMNWSDTRERALWTAGEALIAAVIVFLVALAAAWVDAGAFVMPAGAVVILAASAVSAVAAGLTVVKEWVKAKRAAAAARAAGDVWHGGNF
jgi:hypothetical protein